MCFIQISVLVDSQQDGEGWPLPPRIICIGEGWLARLHEQTAAENQVVAKKYRWVEKYLFIFLYNDIFTGLMFIIS